MKKLIRPLLLRIPTITAWDRDELLEEIEKIYQDKKRKIIGWTVVGLTITNVIVQTIIYLITGK